MVLTSGSLSELVVPGDADAIVQIAVIDVLGGAVEMATEVVIVRLSRIAITGPAFDDREDQAEQEDCDAQNAGDDALNEAPKSWL